MATGIDPRMYGQLEQSVTHLSKSVEALTVSVKELSGRLGALEDRYKFGRAAVIGILLAATLAAYGASEFIDKLLKVIAR